MTCTLVRPAQLLYNLSLSLSLSLFHFDQVKVIHNKMSKRMELLPFKRSNLDGTSAQEQIPGLVVYDADAGKVTVKHRYYVFDQANFAEFVPATASEVKLVVQVLHVGHCKEQMVDPSAASPSQVTASWNRAEIKKVQP